jgi:D-alanine-D-alanine ligase
MHIGVIYCLSGMTANGREMEKLADDEVDEIAHAIQAALVNKGHRADLVNISSIAIEALRQYDWVFNLVENTYGYPLEEYEVAAQLEKLGIGFTGSGSTALKECMDKGFTKARLRRNGISTPAYEIYYPSDAIQTRLKFPLFVKPMHEDGSIGITEDSLVSDREALERQVKKVHQLYQQAALVEEYIDGREITASIIGNGTEAVVLPLSENIYSRFDGPNFLSFDAKWIAESKAFQNIPVDCPCELDPPVAARIRTLALKACRLMKCQDYARVDFRLRGKTPFVLEVNPNPCLYPAEWGFPRAAKEAGYSYDEMIQLILTHSIKRGKPRPAFSRQGEAHESDREGLRKGRQTSHRDYTLKDRGI